MPTREIAGSKIWRRRTTKKQFAVWFGWLIGVAIFVYCWQLISEKTIWLFVTDAPKQAADMVNYYVKLVGVDHVGIASDDLFSTENIIKFAKANAAAYDDGGYMVTAFNKGSTDSGMLARILKTTWSV